MTTTSTNRTAANRSNAALSTGPCTAYGKSVSSRNATLHGLTGHPLLIFHWESQTAFRALAQAYHDRFRPLDPVEASLVERLVDTTWRRNRALAIETTLYDLEISGLEDELAVRMPKEADNGILRIAIAFRDRHRENASVTIQRLIAGLERSFSRARRELQILQKDRFNNTSVEDLLAIAAAFALVHKEEEDEENDAPLTQTAATAASSAAKANPVNTIRKGAKSNPTPSPAPVKTSETASTASRIDNPAPKKAA